MIARRPAEILALRDGGRRLAAILRELARAARPGVSTLVLDRLAERLIREAGGLAAFQGYRAGGSRPFPASVCTSINDEVVHAIPSRERILHPGDILGLDIGMRYPASGGLITDTAMTVAVGSVEDRAAELLEATRGALAAGIRALRPGIRMGDLGYAIQSHIESSGFAVVRELVGHGVGRRLHEPPYVPNYGRPGEGMAIPEGMVLAVEPMATAGGAEVVLSPDGWTWRTRDGSPAAHFEHTVIVTKTGAEILTKAE